MDRKTICEAQAAICTEQASRGDSDRTFWLAEAQRWHDLSGEHAHAVVRFEDIAISSKALTRDFDAPVQNTVPPRRN
jgi:hypothetical protein